MKFPYGNADFYQIITENYFYVDRTNRIPFVETFGKTLLFLRPRRFGKSLWLSTLWNYYDLNRADEFEQLFGHLAIGQKPTPKHNQYLILKWNFSEIETQGDVEQIRQLLHDHINDSLKDFSKRYRAILPFEIEFNPKNAISSLTSTLTAVQATPYKVYLLIDEYDNFANEVLMARRMGSEKRYDDLIKGEGMLKTLFKAVKNRTEGQGIDRVFITGVSPVVMSDVTSGFNVADNIYLEPEFNDLCGFTEAELISVLEQVAEHCQLSSTKTNEMLTLLRMFYDGYSFSSQTKARIYNPTLVLYFLKYLYRTCRSPEELLDENLAMDRGKIAYISQLSRGEELVWNSLHQHKEIALERLARRFGVEDILASQNDNQFLISLLYYFGVLTLTTERNEYGKPTFKIPNLVIQGLYAERIREMILPTGRELDAGKQVTEMLYQRGQIEPLCDFIEQRQFKVFDNRDYREADELVVKAVFLALLFNDIMYIMDSEPAFGRRYGDLLMLVRSDKRQYALLDILIEFKYVSLSAVKLTGEQVRNKSRAELQALPTVQNAFTKAEQQLVSYRQILDEKYGDILDLRTFTVVSVGYDRLVWQGGEGSTVQIN
ncbi:AAA family ATPase [Anaerolineales bacterium HSG6]|nr:AAA family ATPase [Anaerolineales bacterium HSG6]MDM8530868.1 AAA family ATPase [Anaerolineales bacterium HSG25]